MGELLVCLLHFCTAGYSTFSITLRGFSSWFRSNRFDVSMSRLVLWILEPPREGTAGLSKDGDRWLDAGAVSVQLSSLSGYLFVGIEPLVRCLANDALMVYHRLRHSISVTRFADVNRVCCTWLISFLYLIISLLINIYTESHEF